MPGLSLLPEAASTLAVEVDHLFLYLLVITGFFAGLIALLVIVFAVRYRRTARRPIATSQNGFDLRLETLWTIIPTGLAMTMFLYGAKVYFDLARPPDNAVEVYIVARQWMWKAQHIGGQREINELHIPVGQPIRLTMISEDVVHSFFVPAFRTKQDVLPGRYTSEWFTATKPGKYHLFCAEYCGAKHSGMIGYIYALAPADYQAWMINGAPEGSLASSGEKTFHQFGCANCHRFDKPGRCPNLRGLFGRQVELKGGELVTADEAYIRRKILTPNAQLVYGFDQIMPTFKGLINEDQMLQLIEYIKSIGPQAATEMPSTSGELPEQTGAGKGIGAVGTSSIAGTEVNKR